ncbi:hypothetical protein [Aureimonas ureilytica]|uniref:hypothetical protein n=2 Tax=Aureimonas TaxID=414371 RepID=UPI00128EC975|nr:hypothetical protein [Aureimonas ureilytica]
MANRFGFLSLSAIMTLVYCARHRSSSIALAAVAAVLVMREPVHACTYGNERFYLTTTIPPKLPADSLVAEVEVTSVERSFPQLVIITKVRSVISGGPDVTQIVIDMDEVSSCDRIPNVGDHGILAGVPHSLVDNVATIEPIRSPGFWSDDVFPPRKQLGVGRITEKQHP